jgi:hypothetical protein
MVVCLMQLHAESFNTKSSRAMGYNTKWQLKKNLTICIVIYREKKKDIFENINIA